MGEEMRPTEIKVWSTRGFRSNIKVPGSEGGLEAKTSQAPGIVFLLQIAHSPILHQLMGSTQRAGSRMQLSQGALGGLRPLHCKVAFGNWCAVRASRYSSFCL